MSIANNIVGGKWWKFDFHLHTPASYDYGHCDKAQKNITPEDFLINCMSKELDCIAITDHNSFDWISKLKSALINLRNDNIENFREITIFPGVEINTLGNVHLLGIFDPYIDLEHLKSVMVKIGYDADNQTTTKPLHEVIEIIADSDGIAIPAHVDLEKGLFKATSDIKRTVYNTQCLLALEMMNSSSHDGLYFDSKLKLAHVLGSDSHSVETIADKFTWVKMGKPNIEALRLALYDGNGAIQRSDELNGCDNPNNIRSRTYIKNLIVENGRYIGKGNLSPYEIQFNPFFNTLIGGRGTGKSTIINFLRLILNREQELPEELKKEFKNFTRVHQNYTDLGMLESDTNLFLTMVIDGIEHKLQWKDGKVLELCDGIPDSIIDDIENFKERFPVHIFSQKQLYEMTKDTSKLFEYVDSYWKSKLWQLHLSQAQEKFKELFQQWKILNGKKQEYNRLKKSLNDVTMKLKIFESDITKKILAENSALNNQIDFVQDVYRQYESFIDMVCTFNSLETETLSLPDVKNTSLDSTILDKLGKWANQFLLFQNDFKNLILHYPAVQMSLEEFLTEMGLTNRRISNDKQMEIVIKNLKDAGVDDVDKYEELLWEQRQLQEDIRKYQDIDSIILDKRQELKDQFDFIHNLILERYIERFRIIEYLNNFCSGFLKLKLNLFGDLKRNAVMLRGILRKTSGFDSDIFEDSEESTSHDNIICRIAKSDSDGSPQEQIEKLKKEKNNILKKSGNYSVRFIKHLENLLNNNSDVETELYAWVPEDSLELEIKIDKHFKTVEMGSRGQRSSAILALILNTSNVPIIIDQPEDDLDTKHITDMIVKNLNKIKNHIQIIFATHNPNIVVNANSEYIINLDFKNGQIINACCGALQEHSVRDAICDVMEGGKEALERRYYRIFKALNP